MVFTNPAILQSDNDIKIGRVKSEKEEISFLSYMTKVRIRLSKLVIDFVKSDMADGATKDEAIKDCLSLIYSTLNIDEKKYPSDEEGVVDEIESAEEFQNWKTDIKYRFLNTHAGVVMLTTPIPIAGKTHSNIMEQTIELLDEEDTLQVFLDGLAGTGYIE